MPGRIVFGPLHISNENDNTELTEHLSTEFSQEDQLMNLLTLTVQAPTAVGWTIHH